MASKGMSLNIKPEQVMGTRIQRTKSGYNNASMAIKIGENEFMTINYEWEGDSITDTAMDFMSFMTSNKDEIEKAKEDNKETYENYLKNK